MLRLNKIALEGFRSFKDDQVFVFPKEAGLYLVTGENKITPELGSNASGKSSLYEGLSWILYGKTSRGLRGKDIANRDGDNLTSGCLEFYVDEKLYAVTRTWNPISVVLDSPGAKKPKLVDQDQIDVLLGSNHPLFLRTVLFGQFQSFFFDETPSEKVKILSDVLDLHVWDKAGDNAKALLKELEKEAQLHIKTASRLDAEIDVLSGQLSRNLELSKNFEVERQEAKLTLTIQLKENKAELEELQKLIAQHEQDLVVIDDKLSKKQNTLEVTLASRRNSNEAETQLTRALAVLNDRLSQLTQRFGKLTSIKGPCPFCLQEVTSKHRTSIIEEFETEKETLKAEITRLRIQEEGCSIKAKEFEQHERTTQKELRTLLDHSSDLEKKITVAKVKVTVVTEAVKKTELLLVELQNKTNVSEAEAFRLAAQVKSKKELLTAKESEIDVVRANIAKAEYWAGKFKDVRLWVVEQALTELELHVNNALEELGLIGFKIKLDIERPKSDGSGTIKSFQVFITTASDSAPILWESFSGGELQRLRLASTIGLADLIASRKGFQCDTEIWDEPTAHLSQEGIEDLLAVLNNRARLRDKKIWLIDHRSLNAGDFDGYVHIVKDELGSHIMQHQPRTEVIKK